MPNTRKDSVVEEGDSISQVHDVIIIGAGPCGLAIASRLREPTPSALFTDDEHRRYHWIKRHRRKMTVKDHKTGLDEKLRRSDSVDTATHGLKILVLDKSDDEWMANWNRLFSTFEISHLRSPMFFHVDPRDRDGLLAFSQCSAADRDELVEIKGCVGKERSKHQRKKDRRFIGASKAKDSAVGERDRRDYFCPSQNLFRRFCEETLKRYDLDRQGMIRKEEVLSIDYGDEGLHENEPVFKVRTTNGVHLAKICVLAVGAGQKPKVPVSVRSIAAPDSECCHAMNIKEFPSLSVKTKMRDGKATSVMVVGGGLTAAHIALNALRHGVEKVYLCSRSPIKVKHFDLDLNWVGKYRNTDQAVFWSADSDEERLEMLLKARNGGSISPRVHDMLLQYVKSGRLVIEGGAPISQMNWDREQQQWCVSTDPAISGQTVEAPCNVAATPFKVDYIYYATGLDADIAKMGFLHKIRDKYPIKSVGGLPCLNNDLAWSDEVPLFLTGRLAALRIGPGAANLSGARAGAERIAWAVQDLLADKINERNLTLNNPREFHNDAVRSYAEGQGSRFAVLQGD